MEEVYKFVQTKGDDIDFQRGGGFSELNRAHIPPCCCYLHISRLRLVKREVVVGLEYLIVPVSL